MSKDTVANEFDLIIVSPDKLLFEGQSTKVIVPGTNQELAILPDHTPLYAQLKSGSVTINTINSDQQNIEIEGGIIRVRNNRVSIITGFPTAQSTTKPKIN